MLMSNYELQKTNINFLLLFIITIPHYRAVCHITAEIAEENIMIKTLAMNFDTTEYSNRLLESEVEKKSWSSLLPIFYYNETLFPGGRLDLHLFEQRYRVMMQRVVNSTRSFAYVPSFNQYNFNAAVGDVALVAVLEEVEFLADGRCMLQAKISNRMVISDHYIEDGTQGLHFCRLLPLVDDLVTEETDKSKILELLPLLSDTINTSFWAGAFRSRLEKRYGPSPGFGSGLAGAEAYSL